jgi:hypothetical protein
MAGSFSGLFTEILNRLETARGVGKKLEDVKSVLMGKRRRVITAVDCPALDIVLQSGNELPDGQNRKRASFVVNFTLTSAITDKNAQNLYLDLIDLMERVLDVLNETTSQALDPRYGQESQMASVGYSFQQFEQTTDAFLKVDFQLEAHTKVFLMNERNL